MNLRMPRPAIHSNKNSVIELSFWFMGLGFLAPALYLLLTEQIRPLLAVILFAFLIVAWQCDKAFGLVVTFIYLSLLGDLRRIIDMLTGGTPGADLLLLTGAVFAIYLALPILLRLKLSGNLSKAIFVLMALMVLEIFNPQQGPLIVGLGGVFFYIIPILWFWIGRHYANERMMYLMIYRALIPTGVIAATLGIYQTYVGLLPWEKIWAVAQGGMYTLGVDQYRPFGFSTSTHEYSALLMLTTICVIAAIFAGHRVYGIFLIVLVPAMVFASGRTALFRVVVASAMMWAVMGRNSRAWVPRLAFSIVAGIALLVSAARYAGGDTEGSAPAATAEQAATAHVTQGLANPLDSKRSTGGLHIQIFWAGIVSGFTNPQGLGLGSVTLAATKFGGVGTQVSSETDISDTFTALGFVGGFLWLSIIVMTFKAGLEYLQRAPKMIALPLVGMLTGNIGSWIELGSYGLGPLTLLCIGFLAREQLQNQTAAQLVQKTKTRIGSFSRRTDA